MGRHLIHSRVSTKQYTHIHLVLVSPSVLAYQVDYHRTEKPITLGSKQGNKQ